ncbi:hypothetical protein OQA88_1023 [Cercophora sp. LCS_1]
MADNEEQRDPDKMENFPQDPAEWTNGQKRIWRDYIRIIAGAFRYYRRGDYGTWEADRNRISQNDLVGLTDIPRRGHWPDFEVHNQLQHPRSHLHQVHNHELGWHHAPSMPPDDVLESIQSISEDLANDVRFVRILGWEGGRITALYDCLDDQGGLTGNRCVITTSNASDENQERVFMNNLNAEKMILARLFRSAHIVGLMPPPPDINGHGNILFQPWCPRGNVWDWLIQTSRGGGFPIDEDVLWHMFDCLVKACIGMHYPPIWNRMSVTETKLVGDFALTSVLIGDLGHGAPGDDHDLVPPFRITSFNKAQVITEDFLADKGLMWKSRSLGRSEYWTPEQFSEEWEWVVFVPNERDRSAAGRYATCTNIYQIGNVMAMAIAGQDVPANITIDAYGTGAPTPMTIRMGAREVDVFTYGAWLDSPAFDGVVSDKLKELVKQCLCHEVDARPKLEDLQAVITDELQERANKPFALAPGDTDALFGFPVNAIPSRSGINVTRWLSGMMTHLQFHQQQPLS